MAFLALAWQSPHVHTAFHCDHSVIRILGKLTPDMEEKVARQTASNDTATISDSACSVASPCLC